jgi:hypothetical protein
LSLDGSLVVDTLDGKEGFAQRVGHDQVVLELVAETLAERNGLGGNMVGGGKGGEEEEKRKSVVEITESIDEGRVTLLNDMVEGEFRGVVLFKARSIADFTTAQGAGNLLRKRLLVTELVQERLVEQILDILGVVEGCVGG